MVVLVFQFGYFLLELADGDFEGVDLVMEFVDFFDVSFGFLFVGFDFLFALLQQNNLFFDFLGHALVLLGEF